jgi:hypothetical protein
MIKAIFIDFYGTIVHEDGEIIKAISERIFQTSKAGSMADVGAYWWNIFQLLFMKASGDSYQTQRVLEMESLSQTIKHFKSSEDVFELSQLMFNHWIAPQIFSDSLDFFASAPVPIYIVSNIDSADINVLYPK